jgi:hypothetical protein
LCASTCGRITAGIATTRFPARDLVGPKQYPLAPLFGERLSHPHRDLGRGELMGMVVKLTVICPLWAVYEGGSRPRIYQSAI